VQKQAPTLGRLLTMVIFALSCFGLLLFLWLSFGGPIPLKPKGYRVVVAIPEANQLAVEADVRSSGVPVGKVRAKEKAGHGNKTLVTLELNREFAPVDADTKVIQRSKTILGERYLEITRGHPGGPTVPEGGRLPDASVTETVELDEVLGILDEPTRTMFRTWQQDYGSAVKDRGQDLNDSFGNLPRFAASGTDVLEMLDQQEGAVGRLVKNTGVVFGALTEREDQLHDLVVGTDQVFDATASQEQALAETFQIFPTFLDESRATNIDLEAFAKQTHPLVRELRPAMQDLAPTLVDVRRLAPDLRDFYRKLDPLITASKTGMPALTEVLEGARPLLGQLKPFLEELNPILEWLEYHQYTTADFLSNGGGALVDTVPEQRFPEERGHYLGQFGLTGPDSLVVQPRESTTSRGNAYLDPTMLEGRERSRQLIFPSWRCTNTSSGGPETTEKGDTDDEPSCWTKNLPGPTRFPHITKADYDKTR
jgi:virulence factor Mce-like protein